MSISMEVLRSVLGSFRLLLMELSGLGAYCIHHRIWPVSLAKYPEFYVILSHKCILFNYVLVNISCLSNVIDLYVVSNDDRWVQIKHASISVSNIRKIKLPFQIDSANLLGYLNIYEISVWSVMERAGILRH